MDENKQKNNEYICKIHLSIDHCAPHAVNVIPNQSDQCAKNNDCNELNCVCLASNSKPCTSINVIDDNMVLSLFSRLNNTCKSVSINDTRIHSVNFIQNINCQINAQWIRWKQSFSF